MNNLSPQGMISWMLLVKERQRLRDLKILQINNAYFKLPALTLELHAHEDSPVKFEFMMIMWITWKR
jgi:hypothetical protein